MAAVDRAIELDELVERGTLLDDERDLLAGKGGAGKLGFAVLLKFYGQHGRFPRGRAELADQAVRFVADQVGVPASELGLYGWTGRTVERHRSQVRQHLGFRECSVKDADRLAVWLAAEVCEAERQHDVVREQLLIRWRAERVEPPTAGRIDRIVRSALRQAEIALSCRIAGRVPTSTTGRLEDLVAGSVDDDEDAGEESVLALVKAAPGSVSLDSMLTEIRKLRAVRAIGLPAGLFGDVGPRVLAGWRSRAAVESPSHLRDHPAELRRTMLAALLHTREREITDTLVELLISTVHKINARADRRVTQELVNAFKKVSGQGEHLVLDRRGGAGRTR